MTDAFCISTKTQCAIPCSSRIPLGIFLSLLLTTAFLCFLNLGGTRRLSLSTAGIPKPQGGDTHQVSREKLFLLLMAELQCAAQAGQLVSELFGPTPPASSTLISS